jgi:two-component system NtrC family sensor kinase
VGGIALDSETRERLVEAARLATLGRLLPSVIHQLSTPLAAIALRVEGLERSAAAPETPASREKAQRYLLAMGEETQRCRELLSALREFAAGGGLGLAPVDLAALCRGAAMLVRHEAMRRQIGIQLAGASVPTVRGQGHRLAQALLALVLNAVDASPPGGRVEIETRADDGRVVVTVHDQGSGIPDEVRLHLFEPFVSTREPGQGLGLGLMACRAIADAHGGSLELQPGSGRGSRFALSVPVGGPADTREGADGHS